MTTTDGGRTALVLVSDVLGAALLGALVESEGWTAVFPPADERDDERAESAVRRLRPAVVLADVRHPAVHADAFHDAVRSVRGRVVLVGPATARTDLEAVARDRPWVHPVTAGAGESLAALVAAAMGRGRDGG